MDVSTSARSRITLKFSLYMGLLLGEPYMKHLDGEIWELRPIRNRILFAAAADDGYVLLHAFVKKTQKTPKEEIEKAKKELADFITRRNI